MQDYLEFLEKAKQKIRIVDHMTYVTYPLVKDKRMLLTILSGTHEAIINTIKGILYYESYKKNIFLLKDQNENLRTFMRQIAPNYNITTEELKMIQEVINIESKHKQSPFEFSKNDKVVILSDNMQIEILTIDQPKKFIILAKNLINKAETRIIS